MAQPLLFGGTQGSSPQSKYLIEFKAGKCEKNGRLVTPDKRKGTVFIQQTEDSLIHFCWKDRTTNRTEDDLIMVPGDVEFEKVPQCTTGRVFVLKFKSGNKHCFYWMQEPKAEKDEELKTKVNQLLSDSGPPRGGSNFSDLSEESDLNQLISNMNQRDLIQLFGGLGGSGNLSALLSNATRNHDRSRANRTANEETMDTDATESPVPATPTSGSSAKPAATAAPKTGTSGKTAGTPVDSRNLAEILSRVNSDVAAAASGSGSQQQSDALMATLTNSEVLEPIITNAELMLRVKEFLPQTEGSHQTTETSLRTTLKSPQYQQAVSMFAAALASGQMGPLMTQFGMSSDVAAAAATGNIEAFVKALEKCKKPESTDVEMQE